MPNLLNLGDYVLSSGRRSRLKIDADALKDADWLTLAALAVKMLPPFGVVWGVPTGGLRFAVALEKYATREAGDPLLIADDVLTSGKSIEALRNGMDAIGVVAFARGPVPPWVTPVFMLNPLLRDV